MRPVTLNVCEAVGRGHPDKIADQISDAVLDDLLDQAAACGQPTARVRAAVETLVCGRSVVLAGEVTAPEGCYLPGRMQALVRDICRKSGVDDHVVADLDIRNLIRPQSPEIAAMTDEGAGDQGIMVGFATRETPHGMPLATMLARGLIAGGVILPRRAGCLGCASTLSRRLSSARTAPQKAWFWRFSTGRISRCPTCGPRRWTPSSARSSAMSIRSW
ncbi:MAG: hypothetical protein HC794_00190 [Nitrospiraceae bacterium]|nr:hypothetical protein [Nitrospiraceae bacterium]